MLLLVVSMSDYSSALLGEFLRGEVGRNTELYEHTALVEPYSDSSELLSFIESIYDPQSDDDLPARAGQTKVSEVVRRTAATDHVGEHVSNPAETAIGVTENDPSMTGHQAFSKIQNSLYNNQAPYIGVMFGSPNTGKTNFACTSIELWRELVPMKYGTDDFYIISNLPSLDVCDYYVSSVDEFRALLFGDETYTETGGNEGTPPEIDPDTPVFFMFDECSTHLDARTHRHEVAKYYTPLLKRFAKVNCDAMHIAHSGLDVHPELRRHTITTEFIFKESKTEARVYEKMEDDEGTDQKYLLTDIPATSLNYSPDDFSPWKWEQ